MANTGQKRARAAQMPPAERKNQLLRAGVASFANKGIGATKHADLARACGISVPAVFSYFPNREALVSAILEEIGNAVYDNVIVPAQSLPRGEQLAATATFYINYTDCDPDYVKAWLTWSMHFAPEIQAKFRHYETRVIGALADMIREGAATDDPEEDTRDRARMILASSAFLAKMVFDGVSEKRREAFVRHVLERMPVD